MNGTMRIRVLSFSFLFAFLAISAAAAGQRAEADRIRAHMEFLASDALQGRESASRNELIAAHYIASQLRQAGIEPAGADGTYLQPLTLPVQALKVAPTLRVGHHVWRHGKQVAFGVLGAAQISGPLQRSDAKTPVKPGAVVFVALRQDKEAPAVRDQIVGPLRLGAAAVLVGFAEQIQQRFTAAARELPEFKAGGVTFIMLGAAATRQVAALPDGTVIKVQAAVVEKPPIETRNVIGVLRGKSDEAILLSAHMDGLGMKSGPGDTIYNGADDDASGVTAVLELARALAAAPERGRTVYFLLTGSEETGLLGGTYFLQHPPVALGKIVANLEFEMIGRPDPKIAPKTLWMTGFDRSTLGPELARQGAHLVADPHPEQQFFARSDNYPLAKKGVVAHGVSSFGLHPQYHQPDDDLAHIDFDHMTEAIESLISPVLWLVNSDFRPEWLPGKKP
jgi:aminopeptidase YwaD